MDNIKKLYEKYRVYLTRPRLEIATVVVIGLCAIFVIYSSLPKKGVLKLDGDTIVYDGNFVNGQAEGKGKLTTEQQLVYEGDFKQGLFQQSK